LKASALSSLAIETMLFNLLPVTYSGPVVWPGKLSSFGRSFTLSSCSSTDPHALGHSKQGGVRISFLEANKVKNTETVDEQGGLCGRCQAIVFSPVQIRIAPGHFCAQCQARIKRMIENSIVASFAPGERE